MRGCDACTHSNGTFMMSLTARVFLFFVSSLFILAPISRAEAEEQCTDCHSQLEKPVKHEGALMGCDSCHAPHGTTTRFPYRLLMKTNDLCFQCHDEAKLLRGGFPLYGVPSNGHPLASHPVSGPKDPLYPNREFSCVSCHNPHSSDMEKLFRYRYKGDKNPYQGNVCAVCHWTIAYAPPAPPVPPWNEQ